MNSSLYLLLYVHEQNITDSQQVKSLDFISYAPRRPPALLAGQSSMPFYRNIAFSLAEFQCVCFWLVTSN
jgi:hypothetical protein